MHVEIEVVNEIIFEIGSEVLIYLVFRRNHRIGSNLELNPNFK